MAFLATVETRKEILWGSNLEGSIILGFFMVFLFIYGSFNNILRMDECEFKYNLQTSFVEFKRNIPFIFSESGSKNVFSKKTFILEIVGYLIALVILSFFIVSFFLSVDVAFALSFLSFGIVIPYASTVCVFRDTAFKKAKHLEKEAKKKLNNDDDEDE